MYACHRLWLTLSVEKVTYFREMGDFKDASDTWGLFLSVGRNYESTSEF
jgi:hypothetical protein